MKPYKIWCIQLFLLCSCFAVGQATPTLTPEQKLPLYSVQHKLDAVQKQEQQMNAQVMQLQQQYKAQFDTFQAQEKKLMQELDAAKKEAFKQAGADEKTFELDDEWTFKAKPTKAEAKPPAPTPK